MSIPKFICKGVWELGLSGKGGVETASKGVYRGHVTPYSLNKAPVFSAAGSSIQGGGVQEKNIKSQTSGATQGRAEGVGVPDSNACPRIFHLRS